LYNILNKKNYDILNKSGQNDVKFGVF